MLLVVLNYFYGITGDYGIAIILLTLAVRIVILPLTIKQIKSMHEMKKWQPKLKQLQEKHKGDRQKLNEEMMKFYSEHKINPFGGCLPLILQFPIFIALYRMLIENQALKGQPFLFFINNLSLAPKEVYAAHAGILIASSYYALIIFMMLSTYVPQKMMSSDPQQDRIMLFMTAFMAFVAWSLPAGVLLYWIVTNIWTIVQQYLAMRNSEEGEAQNA